MFEVISRVNFLPDWVVSPTWWPSFLRNCERLTTAVAQLPKGGSSLVIMEAYLSAIEKAAETWELVQAIPNYEVVLADLLCQE